MDKVTNNRAEIFMNIVSRFNAGKRLNLISRGSYERRCHLSGMRYNKSYGWHTSPWKTTTLSSPGKNFKSYIAKQLKNKSQRSKRTLFQKRKRITDPLPSIDYGPQAAQPEPTEEQVRSEAKQRLLELQVDDVHRIFIEKNMFFF